MTEILLGVVVGAAIVFVFRSVLWIKQNIRDLSDRHMEKFFATAEKIVEWENISEARLDRISQLSGWLKNRKIQLITIKALKEVAAGDFAKPISYPDSLSKEKQALWIQMFYSWLVTVCAQGSIVGVYAIMQLVKCLDPDQPNTKVESAVLRHDLPAYGH